MSILDLFRLDDKVAIVTGASSGLGVAFAHALAEAGADVVLGARRTNKLESVADSVRTTGQRVHTVQTDVADPDQCQRLVIMMDLRYERTGEAGLFAQRHVFVMGARQRQRPAFADESHVRQRLLHRNAAGRTLDDEYEVEVAVSHFGDRPVGGGAAENGAHGVNA